MPVTSLLAWSVIDDGLFIFSREPDALGLRVIVWLLDRSQSITPRWSLLRGTYILAQGDQLLWGSGWEPVSTRGVSRKWSWIWGFVWISMEHNRATSGPPPCAGLATLPPPWLWAPPAGLPVSAKCPCPACHQLPISFSQWGTENERGALETPAENRSQKSS